MEKQFGFIAEFMSKFNALNVFADEGAEEGDNQEDNSNDNDDSSNDGDNSPSVNYEDLIAKARKEEKNKLYPKIEKLENKAESLTEKNNKKILELEEKNEKISELEKKIEAEKNKAEQSDDERVKDLQSKLEDKESKIEELQNTVESTEEVDEDKLRKEIREEIKQEFELKLYREQKINEADGEVIPELVMGSSKEEIDETFEKAHDRYKEIAGVSNSSNTQSKKNRADNPSTMKNDTLDLSNANIRDMSDEEYAEFRKKLGMGKNTRGKLR